MAQYKLVYFNLRARGELARLLFTKAGVQFEDVRFELEDLPKFKPASPFGQFPYLEFGGKKYAQSIAISNYLAREFKLHGKNSLESLRIDEIVGLWKDFFERLVDTYMVPDDQKEEVKRKFKDEEIPKFLNFFETLLKESGTGYFVGNSITLADFALFDTLDHIIKANPDVMKKYPLVCDNRQKVASDDRIAAYLKVRKETRA